MSGPSSTDATASGSDDLDGDAVVALEVTIVCEEHVAGGDHRGSEVDRVGSAKPVAASDLGCQVHDLAGQGNDACR